MTAYKELIEILSPMTDKKELAQLGLALQSGNVNNIKSIPKLAEFFTKNEITCLSNVNSKIYKVKNIATGEDYILKLEAWILPSTVEQHLRTNPSISAAIAPVYYQIDFSRMNAANQVQNPIAHSKKVGRFTVISASSDSAPPEPVVTDVLPATIRLTRIQIQPLCRGGTLDSISKQAMSDETRIGNALQLFPQVAHFYWMLEPDYLFPDGKPSNFPLTEDLTIHLTDLKTFKPAIRLSLDTEPNINNKRYPMYIPIPPPRELSKIHSRHLGINLYCYLAGCEFNKLMVIDNGVRTAKPNFAAPIFTSENGKLFAALIKAMLDDDQTMRPDCQFVEKALESIASLNQLEKIAQAIQEDDLLQMIAASRRQFINNIQDPSAFNVFSKNLADRVDEYVKSNDLAYGIINEAKINKITTLLSDLKKTLSLEPDDALSQTLADTSSQFNQYKQSRSDLGLLEPKLECCALLLHLKSLNRSHTIKSLHTFIVDKKAQIQAVQDPQALNTMKLELKYYIENNQYMLKVNSYFVELNQLIKANPQDPTLVQEFKEAESQWITLLNKRESLNPLLSSLEKNMQKYNKKVGGHFFKASPPDGKGNTPQAQQDRASEASAHESKRSHS